MTTKSRNAVKAARTQYAAVSPGGTVIRAATEQEAQMVAHRYGWAVATRQVSAWARS